MRDLTDFFDFDFDFARAEEVPPIGDTYRSNDDGFFNPEVTFVGDWSQELKRAAVDGLEAISDRIVAGLGDFTLGDGTFVDDLAIELTMDEIDGAFGTLANARPTLVRGSDYTPIVGEASFDIADAERIGTDAFQAVVTHEVLHVMGFGMLWDIGPNDLLSQTEGGLRFTGENAIAAYKSVFPEIAAADPFADLGVPVEEELGEGLATGHWDEEVFGNAELLTPFLGGAADPLTDLTIASLEDIGYVTTYGDDMLFA